MVLISFIKILFLNLILLNQDCVELPGADCLNNGWTNAHKVVSCQGITYMGQFTGGRRISKTFWCPSENLMRLSFTIAKFDSWDGESVFVYKDNVLIGKITYSPYDGTYMCLISHYPDLMEKKSYQFMLPKGQNQANFQLVDNLEADNEESWGIRDITLQVVDPCVNFYSECNFQGDLWKICSGNQTSLSKYVPFKIKSIFILDGIIVQMKDQNYQGGIHQTFTSNQTCLDDFNVIKKCLHIQVSKVQISMKIQ
ncbi:unnamed protein product [Paramecium pentaurelia]|uniref:Uncharacterized protein n=1 Tax=Paramecium pentaurelia TaxID=43138 RepID=A0A8S1X2B9_9CILI|nr:unnamed protein product [Paramecium pentaurelia]